MALSKEHKRKIAEGVRRSYKDRAKQSTSKDIIPLSVSKGNKQVTSLTNSSSASTSLANVNFDNLELDNLSPKQIAALRTSIKSGKLVGTDDLIYSSASTRDVGRRAAYLNLSAAYIASLLSSVETGRLTDWLEFCETMHEDPKVKGLVNSRKSALTAKEMKVVTKDASPASVEAAKLCNEMISNIDDFDGVLRGLQNGIFQNVGVVELDWEVEDERMMYRPCGVSFIPSKRMAIADVDGAWRFLLSDYDAQPLNEENPVIQEPYRFIVHSPDTDELPHYRGLFRSMAFLYYFRRLAIAYQLEGAERTAYPKSYVYVPTNTRAEAIQKLLIDIENAASDTVTIVENTVKIDHVGGQTDAGNRIYDSILRYLDQSMTALVLGGTLVVENASSNGSYALGQIHERSKQEIVENDARALAQTLRSQLLKPFLEMNAHLFGGIVPPIPDIEFKVKVKEPETISQIDLQAGSVTINEMRERKGLDPVTWGEERVVFRKAEETPLQADTNPSVSSVVEKQKTEAVEEKEVEETEEKTEIKDTEIKDTKTKEVEDRKSDAVDEVPLSTTALNGAQVDGMLNVIAQVRDGLIPLATAKAILITAFQLNPSTTDAILAPLVNFKPRVEGQQTQPEQPTEQPEQRQEDE